MTNIHPIIVHFPIALFLTGFALDVIGHLFQRDVLKRAGLILVVLGAVGALAAMLSGQFAEESVEEHLSKAGERVLDTHEDLGKLTAYLLIGVAAIRLILAMSWLSRWRWIAGTALVIYLIAGAVGVGALTVTGYYGGELVYRYGAGVQLAQPAMELQDSQTALPPPPRDDDDHDDD
uniref:Hypothetical conserved protein n=1 Tax=Acetithermum autotrophicum TaxID=1446466 RepID=H5SQM0_ACEAU|nr:hypothetical conserved protein [Candidatus Acetothermum autotrophicum]